MDVFSRCNRRILALCALAVFCAPPTASAADLTGQAVLRSIQRAQRFLISKQSTDGSWSEEAAGYEAGISALAVLALINAGMTIDDPPVRKGIEYLRSRHDADLVRTYEISLVIMALAAAKDGRRDQARIAALARKLEQGQLTDGVNAGCWSYGGLLDTGGDRSNGQFAILGLRDAAESGYPVDRRVWERADRHWRSTQNLDGGWGYTGRANGMPSTGSMTVAGIATLEVTASMLAEDADLNPDGTPNCCLEPAEDENLERAIEWLARRFSVRRNPQSGNWYLYYLYGLERAGRLTGRRFFGQHDWYREGAEVLIKNQGGNGAWREGAGAAGNPIVGTSFGLLFLSKGLAAVLINKLKFPSDPDDAEKIQSDNWNRHPRDVNNLTQFVTGLPKWPKLLTWQVVDINKAVRDGGVGSLLQAPVLFISGRDAPRFSQQQIALLKEYLQQGGFIFAVANCRDGTFGAGFRRLVPQIVPFPGARLVPLPPNHEIYRAQFPLNGEDIPLEGVDFGCRTAIVFSPDDVSCLWDRWSRQDPPNRPPALKSMIERDMRLGVNVIAYATGRELDTNKLQQQELAADDGRQDSIERGLLQVAKLRHSGGYNVATRALRNLLSALNRTVGLSASTKGRELPASDANIFKYPLLYMHGRGRFAFSKSERQQLRTYLERGGVLFADACCADRRFDRSFRDLMAEMFPDRPFERIPIEHELFSSRTLFSIERVKRRIPTDADPNQAIDTSVRTVEPFLEGIEIDGRYAVIYSKYDISCALERQSSVACAGYLPEDAEKIALNVIMYALLQDVYYRHLVE